MKRLHNLFETHVVTGIGVALVRQYFVKLNFIVDGIGSALAHIAGPTRGTTRGARCIVTYGIFEREMSHAYHTVAGNDIAGEYLVILFQSRRHDFDKFLDLALEIGMYVGHDTADGVIVHRHAGTAGLFEYIKNQLSLAETVEERGQGTEVHTEGREKQQVRRDTHQLVHHRADILCAQGNFKLHGIFDTHTQRVTILMGRKVIKTVGHMEGLRVGHALPQFFYTAVYVTAMHIDLLDNFTFERGTETQYAVSGGVLRTDIDNVVVFLKDIHNFLFHLPIGTHRQGYGRIGTLLISLGYGIVFTARVVIFTQGITVPVFAEEDTAHIGMADKSYAVEVVNFTFFKIGVGPHIAHRIEYRIFAIGRCGFENHPMIVFYRVEVIYHTQCIPPVHSDKGRQVVKQQLAVVVQVPGQSGQLLSRNGKGRILTFFKNSFGKESRYLFLYICH